MRKIKLPMSKPVYLGWSILNLSKTVIYGFWYYYANWKYGEKAKLYYMDTGSSIIYERTDGTFKDISEDVETIFLILQAMN